MCRWSWGSEVPRHEPAIEMFYNGLWNEVPVYVRDGIYITHGRQDRASSLDPDSCVLTIDNRDSLMSPLNPLSDLYGLVGRNTPFRIRMPDDDIDGYLLLLLDLETFTAAKASTPDHADLDITGDIDVRVDVAYNNWTEQGVDDGPFLAGKWYTVTDNRSWRFYLNSTGTLEFEWSTAGTAGSVLTKTSTATVSPKMGDRMAFRATLDVDNGAAGNTVTFYTADTIDGPWTQLGAAVVTGGVTSIFASATAPLELGHLINSGFAVPNGRLYAASVRSGIDGTEVANPDWRSRTEDGGFTDDAGQVWSETGLVQLIPGSTRFSGEIASWEPQQTSDFRPRDASGEGRGDSWIRIIANGILRRKNKGNKPLHSAFTRTLLHGPRGAFGIDAGAIALWPLEDPEGAVSGASIIPGIAPMEADFITFAGIDSIPGAAAVAKATTAAAQFLGFVPAAAYPSDWVNTDGTTVIFTVSWADMPSSADLFSVQIQDDGGNTWSITGDLSGLVDISQTFVHWPSSDSSSTTALGVSGTSFTPSDSTFFVLMLTLGQSGGNVNASVSWMSPDGTELAHGGAVAATLGRIKRILFDAGANAASGLSFSHVSVSPTNTMSTTGVLDGALGHAGETVQHRLTRIPLEEDVILRWQGPTDTQNMGVQQVAKFQDLLLHCEGVDRGILFEMREYPGLAYRPLASLTNQTPKLTLDFETGSIGPPFQPALDDQLTRNDITVTRFGGSAGARAFQATGPMSILDPPDGVGVVDEEITVHAETDDQLPGIAGWLLYLGTAEAIRWPQIMIDLDAAELDATDGLAAPILDVGDVLELTGLPASLSYDSIPLLVFGYTEFIAPDRRTLVFNCVPARPYDTALTTAAGTSKTQSKVGHNATTLAENIHDTETLVDIEVEAGHALWTDSGVDFDIVVGGERMTVTSVTDTGATTQTFTCTRSVNGVVKSHSTGAQVKLFKPAIVAPSANRL